MGRFLRHFESRFLRHFDLERSEREKSRPSKARSLVAVLLEMTVRRPLGLVALALAMGALVVWAVTLTETFDTASSYTLSDSGKMEIVNNGTATVARLKVQKPFHLHDSKTEFDATGAVYTDSEFHTGDVGSNQSGVKTYDSGLVAYYPLNGTTGAIANAATAGMEDTKSTNEGTASNANGTGMAFAAGKFGNGVSFDGVDDYVSAPDSASLDITGALTISVWVKMTAADANATFVAKTVDGGLGNAGVNSTYGFGIRSGLLWFETSDGANGGLVSGASASTDDGNWHHMVAVWDGTTNTNGLKIYKDGAVLYQATSAISSIQNSTHTLRINNNSASFTFTGLIDDVGVYNRALTAAEVATQYSAGARVHMKASASLAPHAPKLAAGYPGLVAYWPLDHASGTAAADLAGANKGTLTNFPASPWAAGLNGNALTFDGVDDYIDHGDVLKLTKDLTLSAWVKPSSFSSYVAVVARSASSNGEAGYGIFVNATSGFPDFFLADGGIGVVSTSSTALSTGVWAHVSATVQGTAMKLYVNGVQTASGTFSGTRQAGTTTLKIGRRDTATPLYFPGSIDEVAIFNRALSAGEIAYLAGKKGEIATYTGPVMDGEIAAAKWDKLTMGLAKATPGMQFVSTTVGSSFTGARAVAAGDMDGDGDLDLVAGGTDGTTKLIKWYKNDGAGTFTETSISTTVTAMGIAIGDLTGDKANDFVVADNVNGGVKWFLNDGLASPAFALQTAIATDASPTSVAIADIDGDGNLDVAAGFAGAVTKIVWYKSDGAAAPAFTAQTAVVTGFSCQHLLVKDINNDGSLDIVAASNAGNTLSWFKGNGGASWTRTDISIAYTGAQYVGTADMDADGDIDLTAAGNGNNSISWFVNDGSAAPTFATKNDLSATYTAATVALPIDFDNDGDMDLISAGAGTADVVDWWQNNGSQVFTKVAIAGYGDPFDLAAVDFTGDGGLDLAAVSNTGNLVTLYPNTPWKGNTIAYTFTGSTEDASAFVVDLDLDGDLDVVASHKNNTRVGYYLASPPGTFGSFTAIDAAFTAYYVYAGDLNQDGKVDVIASGPSGLAWWAQGANLTTWTKTSLGVTDLGRVMIADLDADGRNDIFTSNNKWWKQNATTAGQLDAQTDIAAGGGSAQAVDLDGDGDLDLLGFDAPSWVAQTSPGVFGARTNFVASNGFSGDTIAADLNGDGRLDVIYYNNFTAYYQLQQSTPGTFGAAVNLNANPNSSTARLAAADFDGDGDIDLFGTSQHPTSGFIYLWKNDGAANFDSNKTIDASGSQGRSLHLADLDQDGRLDVLRAGSNDTSYIITWVQQLQHAKVQFQARTDSAATPATAYLGPDGTAKTFYGSGAGVKETNGANLNRYGQYKATLYRNDTTLDPMIKDVRLDYRALTYSTANPYVQPTTGTAITYLTSFAETLSGALPAGTAIKYILTPNNGTNWYYHNGSNWVASDGTYAQSATYTVLNANIAGFDDKAYADVTLPENSTGTLLWRAFFNSDGSVTPKLDELQIGYETGSITATAPNGSEVWKVGSAKNITWTTTGVVPNDLTLEYTKDDVAYTSIATGVTVGGNIEKDPATISGAVGTWRFNGTTGAIANLATAGLTDSAGVNHGTASNVNGTGMAFAAGKYGNAVSFDGVDDYVNLASSNVLAAAGSSISLWFNTTFGSTSGSSGIIVGRTASNSTYIYATPTTIVIQGDTAGVVTFTVPTIAANTWNHLVMTRSLGTTRVYLNGMESSSGGQTLNTDLTVTQFAKYGNNSGTATGYQYIGTLDDVASYNRVLTAAEIKELAGNQAYAWTIPNDVSNTVKVRARSVGVPAIRDKSNANFTIADLNVTAPNGAEFWKVGTSQNITWTATNYVPDDLILEYTTDGTAYTNIAGSLNHTTGTPYAWTVPTGAISATTKVRARSSSATELVDSSNANFTAYALALTAPNGAESWPAGSSQTITWTHNGLPGTTVKLEYSTDGGSTWNATAIATGVAKSAATGCTAPAGGGCYQWTVPSNLSAQARVRITDESQAAVTDASDANFTISGMILSVTAPISSDVWPVTTTQTIKWSVDGPIPAGGTVKLSYSADNGSTWADVVGGGTVDATTGATGFSWGVPTNAASSTAKIKVEDNPVWNPNAVDGTSAAYKVSALVTVNFPNGGEKWAAGSAHNIKWQTTGTLANVNILADLDNNGSFETTLFTNLTNDGVESWTPAAGQASAAAKIRVQSATDATIGDNSNATFKVSTVAVTAPNAAGVRWLAGSAQTLTWTSTGVTNVALDYSTDNGANWTAISASTLSDGTEPWTAALKTSTQALIRVRDADAATGNELGDTALASDNSDNAFAIIGTITVTAPNATGITWASGAPQTITWTIAPANANVVPNVKITITDLINAANNKTVVASTNGQNVGAGSGSYSWIPDFTTTSAKIKVENAADANSNDQSDNAFAIEGIAISAPAGGESWLVGSSQNVQFSWSGTVTSVKLEYSIDNGSAWSTINASWSPPANPATFSWTIPDAIASGTVKVRVTSNNNTSVVATSNAFSITGALAMSTPATLTVGQSATVSWTKTGTIGTVKVEFSPAGTFADTLQTVGIGLTGTSTTWTVPDNIGTTGKLRVTDTVAGHPATTGTSNAFAIAGDFAFTAPISTTAWGVAESRAITWTNSGTMGTVKIEYATDADNYAVWTTITASTTNAGTYTWNPIPDLVGGTPNPPNPISAPTNGKRNVKVRLTDAAHSGTAQVVKASSAFTVKWHLITFNVQNEDGSFLAALNVTDDATSWSVTDASLVSPSSTKRQYKYGTIVTSTWSKTNFTAKTDSFTVTGDATRTITLLSENPEPYEISWNPFHNANNDTVTSTMFLTRRGQLITDTANLTSGKIYIYSGTTLKATLTGSGPSSATGEYTFSFTAGTYGLTAGNSYFVKTEIVYSGTSKFGAGVLPITLPTDTQTVLTRLGAVGDASSASTLFGKLAGLNTLVGATGDASGTSTLFGKMADVKTTLGSSTDTGTTTVFGKVAAVKDIIGTTSDTGTTTVFGKLKETATNTEIAAQTGILTRESSVKTGNTIDIQYRTTTGLSPKVDVYDAKGNKVVSGRTMTEIATTGIYEDPLTLDKSWGTGDFTVLVSESTKGSNDSMILSVLGTDLETIGKKPSGASTAADTTPIMNELRSLRGLMGMTAAQGSLMGQMGQIQQQMSALQAQLGLLGVSEEGDTKGKVQPTIRDQIAEIAKILKSVSGEEGESLATLYDVSEATTKNVKMMQNKVEQIKRAAEVTQKIVEEGRQKVVVQTWFESGSVILKILVVNPTDEMQEVPVKAYLPKEVKPEHIIDKGDLTVEFDPDKTAYFVTTLAKLSPKESAIYAIEVEDIWMIPQEKLTAMSDEAAAAAKQLQETEYAEKAALLASQIDLKLAQMWERQSDPTLTPERHIQVYRENVQALELLEADVAMLKRMVASVLEPGAKSMAGDFLGKAFSGVTANWGDAAGSAGTKYSPSTAMTWRLIFGILAFLGLLSLTAFMLWQHQAQIQIKSDAIALQHTSPHKTLMGSDPNGAASGTSSADTHSQAESS